MGVSVTEKILQKFLNYRNSGGAELAQVLCTIGLFFSGHAKEPM